MTYNVLRTALQNYEVYDETEGSERMLGTASVDLPEIEFLTSTVKGAGVAGEVDVPIAGHTSNLTTTLHWRTIHSDLTKFAAPHAHMLVFRGAIQNYDTATGRVIVSPVKITLRGVPTKVTLGKLEPAEQTESENEFSVDYLKVEVDGEELIAYDKYNYTFRMNGEDYLADTRAAVGQG